jgi:iron complex outermembrane receptor protein
MAALLGRGAKVGITKLRLLGYGSVLALCASVALVPGASAAGNPPAGGASNVQTVTEVVVTARRTAENVQKIPLAVSAKSGAQIDKLVVNTVADLNKLSPGLQVNASSASRNVSQPSIRGQGTSFGTNQSSVINYFAEVPNLPPTVMDLSSLQVVKGPQGTLFGATATGGVLLYEPRRPSQNDLNGYATVEGGNYNYYSLEGAVGGSIVPDKLLFRVAGKIRRRDGFTTAYQTWGGSTDVDNVNQDEWRAAVTFRPTSNFENYFVYSGSYESSHGESSPLGYADNAFMLPFAQGLPPAFVPSFAAAYQFETGAAPPMFVTVNGAPALATFANLQTAELLKQIAAGPRKTFYDYSHQNANRFDSIVNQTKWEILDNLTVRNIFGYTWAESRGPTIDVDGGDIPLVDTHAPVVPGSTNFYNPKYAWIGGGGPNNLSAHQLTDEIQVQGKLFDDRLNWQAGAFGDWESSPGWIPDSFIQLFTLALAPVPDPINGSSCTLGSSVPAQQCFSQLIKTSKYAEAIYTQGTFKVFDNLHVTGGWRHSWAQTTQSTANTDTYAVPFNGQFEVLPVTGRSPIPGTQSNEVTPLEQRDTYTVAVDWQATDHVLLYATNRTGYKPGGINGDAPPTSPNREFGPEDLFDVEIGAKTDWTLGDLRGRSNLAIFRDNYNNIQTSTVIPGTATTITVNAAQAVIQGVEFETDIKYQDWFELNAWYSYLDTYYVKFSQSAPCNAGSDYWYTQCQNAATTLLPGATSREVVSDNAKHTISIVDVNASGAPVGTLATYGGLSSPFYNSAPHTFSIAPTIYLKPWLKEDISVTANVQYTAASHVPNNSFPGVALTPSPPGSLATPDPFALASHTTVDMHIDWRHVMGSRINLSLVSTNLTNALYNISSGGGFTISGSEEYIYNEPRMIYVEFNIPFGPGS